MHICKNHQMYTSNKSKITKVPTSETIIFIYCYVTKKIEKFKFKWNKISITSAQLGATVWSMN